VHNTFSRVGANDAITITATIDSTGAFDNSANAAAAETDPDLANNTDNTSNGGTAAVPYFPRFTSTMLGWSDSWHRPGWLRTGDVFGCDSFATIQGAIAGVAGGGTVNVAIGTYV